MSKETLDYRTSMQSAARAFLRRNQAQYLSDSDLLFDRCVSHLSIALEVPLMLAQHLCQLAWEEVYSRHEPLWLGIDWASEQDATVAYLVDTRDNLRFPIPLRLLPQRLLARRPAAAAGHS